MRSLKFGLVLVMLAVFGVGAAQASVVLDNGVPVFNDGRINNTQIDEPVGIWCTFDYSQNVNVGVFQSIDVWGLSGDKLLTASAAQIAAAQITAKSPTVTLDSADGYNLFEMANDTFEVTAPNGYSFTWTKGATQGC